MRRGITPNLVCFNTVLHACAHKGDHIRALKWLQRTQVAGIALNKITYNSMIDTYAKASMPAMAEHWLHQMVAKGFHPDHITYVTLLRACTHTGQEMDARWTYGAIVKAYVLVGNQQGTCRWLGEMTRAGFKPTRDLYEELLLMCNDRNFFDLASEISVMMQKNCDSHPQSRRNSATGKPPVEATKKVGAFLEPERSLQALPVVRIPASPPGLDTPGFETSSALQIEHFSL